ncbi:MAG TPA: DNA repair and recombination protein RadB [Methanomassiliicoccales archaeon]|nr:DNA repair and recombination protein RadB [Methanomassiliicoccales archaeon]
MYRVPFECSSLDNVLEGGVESSCVTMFYGAAGTGKTNLCLVLARNLALQGKKVVYLDTEGVSMDRFRQVCGGETQRVLKSVLFFEASSFDEQEKMVDKAIKLAEGNLDVGMIVVDSITMFYRLTSREEEKSERRSLTSESVKLLGVARKRDIPVVITSQVFTDIETGNFEALGGHALHHNAKTIAFVERLGPGRRKLTIMKHRHIAEGASAEFKLVNEGIVCEAKS